MSQVTIGIDVSKAQFDIFVSNGQNHSCMPNTPCGIKALIKTFSKLPDCLVVFEATGFYHRALERGLAQAQIAYVKVNPWQARCFAKSIGQLAKTDKVDAKILSTMGQTLPLVPSTIRDEVIEILGEYQLLHDGLVQTQTQWSNRMKVLTDKAAVRLAARMLKTLEKEIEQLTHKTKKLIEAHPDLKKRFDILITIPGIAARTAISLLTHMPELGTLSQKKIGALSGLAPMQSQSGTHKGVACIKGGRAPVRNALYMPALVAMRYNEDLKGFYDRLVQAGKPKKVAIIAVMRKLLTLANALVRENRKWAQFAP